VGVLPRRHAAPVSNFAVRSAIGREPEAPHNAQRPGHHPPSTIGVVMGYVLCTDARPHSTTTTGAVDNGLWPMAYDLLSAASCQLLVGGAKACVVYRLLAPDRGCLRRPQPMLSTIYHHRTRAGAGV
jgi:hypothetical protein